MNVFTAAGHMNKEPDSRNNLMNQNQVTASTTVTIAIPVSDGRLHGHFGGCTHFALVSADREKKTILSTRTVAAPPHAPGFFPRWLHGQGVNAIIAGGIGRRALELFAEQGIEVRAGQPDAPLEELVASFLSGSLTETPEACKNQGHDHDHGHGHGHHHHHHHDHHGHKDANEGAR
jgi:predicted Fe-Mo cluster-binding NifX family protein